MQNLEKITQEQFFNNLAQEQTAKMVIDLHAVMVRANNNFIFTKRLQKLAEKMSDEIVALNPKQVYTEIVEKAKTTYSLETAIAEQNERLSHKNKNC